ncbi:Zinc finger BED domain-containing protein 5 [Eumeta japonica]|uniref:Zinc finger BED domain-containing protein 5 n=1 Tax=Eumeta variegata TaxID=151549 RepID=A0A4C1XRD8_EUMVA|nr:Zinc finger BED domain-containing protein 5 [Eumeta japonica]
MERWLKGVKRVATSSNDAECSKAVRAENAAITDPDDDATTSSSTVSKTKKRKNVIRHKYGVTVQIDASQRFWCRIRDEYPMLGKMALNILLPFPTTYLCDTGFSTYAATKTKYRNRLDAEPDLRLQLSSIKPDINQLMKNKKQFHTSH